MDEQRPTKGLKKKPIMYAIQARNIAVEHDEDGKSVIFQLWQTRLEWFIESIKKASERGKFEVTFHIFPDQCKLYYESYLWKEIVNPLTKLGYELVHGYYNHWPLQKCYVYQFSWKNPFKIRHLRVLARLVIFMNRWREDYYAPGGVGFQQAKENFEKQT